MLSLSKHEDLGQKSAKLSDPASPGYADAGGRP